jgi:hypothetical protein
VQTETLPIIIAAVSDIVFPREGQGFRAELKIGDDYHILLMATHTAVGPVSAIYDVKHHKWWRERHWAEDIDDAKNKAEDTVRAYYRALRPRDRFPTLVWTETDRPAL